jgi:hypothetical protein
LYHCEVVKKAFLSAQGRLLEHIVSPWQESSAYPSPHFVRCSLLRVLINKGNLLFRRNRLSIDDLWWEILVVSFPALLALAADPVASLFETSLLGNLGELPLSMDVRIKV